MIPVANDQKLARLREESFLDLQEGRMRPHRTYFVAFSLPNLVVGAAQSCLNDLHESGRGVIGCMEENHETQFSFKDQLI